MKTLGIIITAISAFWIVLLTVFWFVYVAGSFHAINSNLVALLNYNGIYFDVDKGVYEVREFTDFSYNTDNEQIRSK